MIGEAFIDRETERIYHVSGVVPAHDDLIGGKSISGALIIVRENLEARLVSASQADNMEGRLAFSVEVLIRAAHCRYPEGTPFVLYRVADWKSGKMWATPLRQFHREFSPLDDEFVDSALPE